MVHLLDPEEVKKGPSKATEEARARNRNLSEEEDRLVKSINLLHAEEEAAKKSTDDTIQKMRNMVAAERVTLELDLAPLRAERTELMKPIEIIQKEADDRNEKSKERETAVTIRELDVSKREEEANDRDEDITNRLEKMADRDQLQDERSEDLDKRDEKVKDAEAATVASAQSLSGKWADYHAEVLKTNEAFAKREAAINAAEKVNEIARLENEKRAENYKEKDREIASRYEALERAHLQILGNKK